MSRGIYPTRTASCYQPPAQKAMLLCMRPGGRPETYLRNRPGRDRKGETKPQTRFCAGISHAVFIRFCPRRCPVTRDTRPPRKNKGDDRLAPRPERAAVFHEDKREPLSLIHI